MVKITMEIIPHGVEKEKYFMGEMIITNIGKAAEGKDIYIYSLVDKDRKTIDGGLGEHDRTQGFMKLVETIWKDHISIVSDIEKAFNPYKGIKLKNGII